MAGAKEEIVVAINKEVIGVIKAPITTMEATTAATGKGDGVEVATIMKGKEADITMERVEGATIKTAATKDREVAILREVKEADTTAWEEVEGQEGAAIKMANN